MRNITKTDEGTVAWLKPSGNSPVQKRKITRIWENANSYEFKYDRSQFADLKHMSYMHDGEGFSPETYRDVLSHWKITETIARYDQPLNFWREIKVSLIRGIHLIMERMEFNFKS